MDKGYMVCVDDDTSVLETLQEQLREHFQDTHYIEIANSAESALELIGDLQENQEIIEVIISDQLMPGMKGDKFLEEIHKKLPDSIKILLTGQAGLDSAIRAINHGGLNRYMEKPWNIAELTQNIKQLSEKFRENLENQKLLQALNKKIRELEDENKSLKNSI